MATITDYEDLECWKKAREVTNLVYSFTKRDQFSRDFELLRQIRKSAISVMSNISEGFERDGNREFLNFLSIAKGSLGEVRAQMYIALDQQYVTQAEFQTMRTLTKQNASLIAGLMNYIRQSKIKGQKFR